MTSIRQHTVHKLLIVETSAFPVHRWLAGSSGIRIRQRSESSSHRYLSNAQKTFQHVQKVHVQTELLSQLALRFMVTGQRHSYLHLWA